MMILNPSKTMLKFSIQLLFDNANNQLNWPKNNRKVLFQLLALKLIRNLFRKNFANIVYLTKKKSHHIVLKFRK